MAGLSTGAPIVKVYHEKSMILPDVSRVLACLYEKDIKFETHTASYKSLLRLQAPTNAPVPFYDGPIFLEESREICRYIAETYEHHGYRFLLGKDALERASIEQWLHHEEHNFNPPSRSLFCHLAFSMDDDDIDLQKRKLEEVLEVYEQRLSDSEFLAGNKFTLADLVHLPNSHYITSSDKFVYLYDSRKNVQRWWNAISTRDSWQKVLRDIKKVEQQSKLDELEKQKQQQRQKEHPTNTGRQIRLDPRKHISTESQTKVHEIAPDDYHTVELTQDVPSDALGKTEFVKPTSTDQEGMEPTAGPASTLDPQLAGTLQAEGAHAEQEPVRSDQESVRDAQPPSSVESRKEDTNVFAADQSKASQTISRQEATPPAPIRTEVPTSDTHDVIRKAEEVTPGNLPSDDSAIPPVPSEEQVSHAPQTIPDKKDMTPSPGTRGSPVSETQLASGKVHEAAPDDYRTDELTTPFVSSEKQGLHVVSAKPHEGPSPDAHGAVVDKETTKPPSGHAEGLKARPDSTPTHGYVGPTSGDEPAKLPDQGAQSPAPAQATYFEAPRDSASTQDVPADALGNFKKQGPHSADEETIASTPGKVSDLDSQPDSAPSEVTPAAKKIALSDQGSVHSAQQPSPAEPRKEESIVAAVEQKLPTIIGQRETQGMRAAPQHGADQTKAEQAPGTSEASGEVLQVGPGDHRSGPTPDTHGAVVDEKTEPSLVSHAHSLETGPDSTPAHGDVHPTSGDEPATGLLREQETQPPPASQNIAPDDDRNKESVSSQEQVSHDQHASERHEGSPPDLHGAFVDKKTTTPSSSQTQSSDAKRDSTLVSASAPSTQIGSAPDEVAPNEEKFSLSDQDLARSAQPPYSAEPTKEDTIVAPSDQTNAPRTIIGQQDTTPAQKNNGTSQGEALDQLGKQVSEVQLLNKNTDNGSKSTKSASSGIQTDNKSEAPASKTEQPNERDLPANSTRSINSQSQAEASVKSEEQSSSSIYNKNQNSSKLDGSTDDLKSGDMENNPSP